MNDVGLVAVAAIVGYLLGSLSFARIIGRIVAPGVDLTHTTIIVPNTGERFEIEGVPASALTGRASWPWRLAVVLLDMAKAGIPTFAFHALFPASPAYAAVFAAAVLGHNWPIYYRFVGGYGISSIIGAVVAFDPLALLVTIPIGVVVGKFVLDSMSMINGFTLLLPIWFLVVQRNVEATIASVIVLVAYWIAKRTRLTHIKPSAAGGASGGGTVPVAGSAEPAGGESKP